MTDLPKTKPCPWCGHEGPHHVDGPLLVEWVRCDNLECLACGPVRETPEQAIAAWNALSDLATAAAWLSEIDRTYCAVHPGIFGMWQLCEEDMSGQQVKEAKNRDSAAERLASMRVAARKDLDAAIAALPVTPM